MTAITSTTQTGKISTSWVCVNFPVVATLVASSS